ncbi:hypothetical protein OBP_026 [Pseudomonas phage OBP]|uniref:hypothetical protein n=1 Tax=Pseudomonas phage OBP TaxID=1124849 RepID=UPI000240D617|nr:hypothetical protein OBP_026 [Pseudomonas phage OBP]AEV89463.1 hypothetical protein OBP_026 [Pseudomonas phage OBP]
MRWLKRLIRVLATPAKIEANKVKVASELDKAFNLLVTDYPKQSSHRGHMGFDIGHYTFQGGWLKDEFYFDVYDLDYEFRLNKEGRIYVGYHKFPDMGVRWSVHKCGDKNKVVDSLTLHSPDNLYKGDFIKSLNFIIPGLVEEVVNESES